jgi:hypothetical protein
MEIGADLKRLARVSSKTAKLIEQYTQKQGTPEESVYVLEKKLDDIERSSHDLPDCDVKEQVVTWLREQRERIKDFKEEFRFTFGKKLASLFSADGISIRGQYPIVRIAWYTVKMDFEFGEAELYYGPEIEKIGTKMPLHPDVIYDTIKRNTGGLDAIGKDVEKLLSDVRSAYQRALKIDGKQPGDKASITEVMDQFVMIRQTKKFRVDPRKNHFQQMSRVEFSYIMHTIKKTHPQGLRLHVATFDATVDKAHALWIPEDEEGEGTHYSYLSFDMDAA